jgi:hypothetical protein
MALETLAPLTYSAFVEKTDNSIQGIIDYFNNEDHEFWLKTLKTYSFQGQDFRSGTEKGTGCFSNRCYFEETSKRKKGFPSETRVKKGYRVVHGEKDRCLAFPVCKVMGRGL